MKINEWRSMAHWNRVLPMELARSDTTAFGRWVAIIAMDERFASVRGYARVRRKHGFVNLFSLELVHRVHRATPGGLEEFVRASSHLSAMPITKHEFTYVEDEDYTISRMNLSSEQSEYARSIHEGYRDEFGWSRVFTHGDDRLCDPALARVAGSIARRRFPSKKKASRPGR